MVYKIKGHKILTQITNIRVYFQEPHSHDKWLQSDWATGSFCYPLDAVKSELWIGMLSRCIDQLTENISDASSLIN